MMFSTLILCRDEDSAKAFAFIVINPKTISCLAKFPLQWASVQPIKFPLSALLCMTDSLLIIPKLNWNSRLLKNTRTYSCYFLTYLCEAVSTCYTYVEHVSRHRATFAFIQSHFAGNLTNVSPVFILQKLYFGLQQLLREISCSLAVKCSTLSTGQLLSLSICSLIQETGLFKR